MTNKQKKTGSADGATATQPRTNNSRILLGLIMVLAFFVSFSNLALGGRASQYYPQQWNIESLVDMAEREVVPFHDDISDSERIYDGEIITQILIGERPFPGSNDAARRLRLKFKPGTLQMSSADALQYCFVNATHYRNHIADRNQCLVSVSDEHKIIYRNVPKSSSSSSRHAMQDFFKGDDVRMKHDDLESKVHEEGYTMVSFVREPMSRFYSSYDEAFFRMGPWMGDGPIVSDKPKVKKAYHENKYKVDKYPYLYEGFQTIEDFRRLYCPEEVLRTGRFLDCNNIPSIDDGNLAHRFEQFVRDYSGVDPFDVHLNLQISNLVFSTGEPLPISKLYNALVAEKGWQELASQRGVTIPNGAMTHGRKITRRFNVSKVSKATNRKICRLLALDYCCLNIELPEACWDDVEKDEAVYCAMEQRHDELMKFALNPLVIQAWKDP